MESIFFIAALWLALAVIAAVLAYHLDVSIALEGICLGIAAAAFAERVFGKGRWGTNGNGRRFSVPWAPRC